MGAGWADQGEDLAALRFARRAGVLSETSVIPVVPGKCLLARCPEPAVPDADGDEEIPALCAWHQQWFRPRCARCGAILSDIMFDRGYCGRCWSAVPRAERGRIAARVRCTRKRVSPTGE